MNPIDEISFHEQPALRLQGADGASAIVLLHGAHVVSWMPVPGDERLYMSPTSCFGEGEAIRGGVPVIFPRFALTQTNAEVPRHGFARTRGWRRVPRDAGPGSIEVELELATDAETCEIWPHRHRVGLVLNLAPGRLTMTLAVRNEDAVPFAFTAALHTYFQVASITDIAIAGLEGLEYLDKVTNTRSIERAHDLRISGEVDRVYEAVKHPIVLRDASRTLTIGQRGFADAVVWNPWATRCADLPDMPDSDFRRMVCIEAAQVAAPVELTAGGLWEGSQVLSSH